MSTAKKVTKLEALSADLERAKARLAEATARLQPQIDQEQARADELGAVYEKAAKKARKAYENSQEVKREAEARLFPAPVSQRLRDAIRARVSAQLPDANIARLAAEFESAAVKADALVVAAYSAQQAAHDAEEKARTAYWRAKAMDSKLVRLQRELGTFRASVKATEKELERLPRYRQAAKDRRAEERQEVLETQQTEQARALLVGFRFDMNGEG